MGKCFVNPVKNSLHWHWLNPSGPLMMWATVEILCLSCWKYAIRICPLFNYLKTAARVQGLGSVLLCNPFLKEISPAFLFKRIRACQKVVCLGCFWWKYRTSLVFIYTICKNFKISYFSILLMFFHSQFWKVIFWWCMFVVSNIYTISFSYRLYKLLNLKLWLISFRSRNLLLVK